MDVPSEQERSIASNPSLWITKALLVLMAPWSLITLGTQTVTVLTSLAGVEKNMIFEGISEILLMSALLLGVMGYVLITYYFEWQDYQKDKGESVKFSLNYLIAVLISIVVSGVAGYVIVEYGLGYIAPGTIVEETAVAVLLCVAIGFAVSWLVDVNITHPLADGTAAKAKLKADQAIREASERAIAEALARAGAAAKNDDTVMRLATTFGIPKEDALAKAVELGLIEEVTQ